MAICLFKSSFIFPTIKFLCHLYFASNFIYYLSFYCFYFLKKKNRKERQINNEPYISGATKKCKLCWIVALSFSLSVIFLKEKFSWQTFSKGTLYCKVDKHPRGGGGSGFKRHSRGGGERLKRGLRRPCSASHIPHLANKGSATSNLKLYDVISYETVMKHY